MSTNKKANRLIHEKSPYLLQHAYNPVDWFPWSDEAFEKAKAEDKPIFLSIGYSTCHWCHVMEKESFEDEEVAKILNKHYVSIKVDRELRPDIDHIYMRVCQGITGSGGWPLSIFMTPDQKPFYAGTYFPKETKGRYLGFIDILTYFAKLWETDKERLYEDITEIDKYLKKSMVIPSEEPDIKTIDKAYRLLKADYDPKYGGFGTAPKFPTPHNLLFLLRYYKITSDTNALHMAEHTLTSMYKGGIFDHIGYGFSRYSTDQAWLVPHFEKMLYDNALLAIAYSECYACTKKELYKDIAEKIFAYVFRDLTSSDGAFYSAEDADSEGEEGKFYVWSYNELFKLFNENKMSLLQKYYGVTKEGNFSGSNILNLIETDLDTMDPLLKKEMEEIRTRLCFERLKRTRPFKDTKILVSWNGMMIAALAIGGRILQRCDYIIAAKKAVNFILRYMTDEKNHLLNGYKEGENSAAGFLDDYAYMIYGLIELYQSTFDSQYLKKALDFNRVLINEFWDEQSGGFFFYGNNHESLILRPKEHYDGATPSGNSVAAMNLLRLYEYTSDLQLKEKADEIFKAFGKDINNEPAAHIHFVTALMAGSRKNRQIIFTGKNKDELIKVRKRVDSEFLPFTTVLFHDGNESVYEVCPHLRDYITDNQVTAYICEDFACQEPTKDIERVLSSL